jgi:hypothetical protein
MGEDRQGRCSRRRHQSNESQEGIMPPQETTPREAMTITDQPNVPELYVDGIQAVMVANAVVRLNLLREIAPSTEGGKRRLVIGRTFIPLNALLDVAQVLNAVITRMRQDGALPPEQVAAPPI